MLKLVTWPWPRPLQRRLVCYRKAGACCGKPTHQIWSAQLHPLREIWKALQNVENGAVWGG